MNRAPTGDLPQPLTLAIRQRPLKLDVDRDPVDQTLFGLAIGAILSMHPVVRKTGDRSRQRPTFAIRVETGGNSHASAERRQQELVRVRTRVCAAYVDRFICRKPMRCGFDLDRVPRTPTPHLDRSLRNTTGMWKRQLLGGHAQKVLGRTASSR